MRTGRNSERGRIIRTADDSADAIRRRVVLQEQNAHKRERRGKRERQIPGFDETSHGVFICGAEIIRDRYSIRKVSWKGGKWIDKLGDGTAGDKQAAWVQTMNSGPKT